MGRVVKVSVGFVVGALVLLAVALYASNASLREHSRLVEVGELTEARGEVEWAARLDPFNAAPLSSEAYLDLRQGQTEAAERGFREAIGRDPRNHKNYEALGDLQRQQLGDPEAAAQSYRQALTHNPHALSVVSRLGEALLSSGDVEGAEEQYEWLRERGRIQPRDLLALGRIEVRLGKPEEALGTLEEARQRASEELEEDPDGSRGERGREFLDSVDLAVADALVARGDYDEAREYLAGSEAEQATAILALLEEDPEAYRESVLD